MRKIFASASIMGISTLVSLIVGVVRSKVMAVLLGPMGVGVISQAFSFLTTASTVASLGLGVGIAKFIPLYEHEKKSLLIKQAVLVSFLLHISISLLWIILIICFPGKISFMIFSTPIYARLLIFVALAIPCATLVYFVASVFISLGNIKAFTVSRVWGYLIGLVPMFILIYFWGVKGGFIQIFLVAFVGFIFALYYFLKVIPREFYLPKEFHELSGLFPMGRRIFKYGLAMLATTALASFSILAVRSIIIHRIGTVANGYYQVLVAFSAYYLPFFTNALWGHFYPRINSTDSSAEVSKELNNTVRFLSIGITLCIVALLIFKRYLVLLVFSNKFLNAIPYMESQFMGDFFSLLSITFGCLILAKGKIRIYFLNALFTSIIFISLSLLMFKHFAIFAVTLSYLMAQLISASFLYIYYKKYLKLYLSETTLQAILYSLILLTVAVLLPNGERGFYFKTLALVLWFFIIVKKSERNAIMGLIKEKLNFPVYRSFTGL